MVENLLSFVYDSRESPTKQESQNFPSFFFL